MTTWWKYCRDPVSARNSTTEAAEESTTIMDNILSKINDTQIAQNINSSVLKLLDANSPSASESHLLTFCAPVLAFAAADNANAPISELESLFAQIKTPGPTLLLRMADRFIENDRGDDAQAILERIDLDGLPPRHKINYALTLAKHGDLAMVEPLIEQAYAEDPTLTDAYASVGRALYWPQDYDKVIEWMEKDLNHA